MGILNSLFGGKVRVIRTKNGDWVNTTANTSFDNIDNLELAKNSSVLGTCIDIFADYTSKVLFTENDNENSEFIKFLNKPNPFHTKEDFLKQLVWYIKCYGWVFQKPYVAGNNPRTIYNLNPSKISFNEDFKKTLIYSTDEINALSDYKFTYQDYNTTTTFNFGDILPFYDVANGIGCNPLTSPSRVDFIKKQLQNLDLATDAENKIINKIGNAMVYKEKSKDAMQNAMPLAKKDQEAIEKGFDSRGVASGNGIIATNVELGYKAVHIPYKDGGFSELLENNVPLVTQAMRIPNEIYKAYKQGDTFTNKETVETQFIQNVIQPFVDNIASTYNSYFKLNGLKANLSHLPSMASLENKKIDSVFKMSQAIRNLTQSGFSIEEAKNYLSSMGIKNITNE